MKRGTFRLGAMIAVALVLTTGLAVAQQTGSGRGPGPGAGQRHGAADNAHHDPFDAAAMVTITGPVDEVLLKPGRSGLTGLHLLVAADGGIVEVAVGPTSYLFPEGLEVAKGDEVTVTGSKVASPDGEIVLASEITAGEVTLALRDEDGLPAWRGQGGRAGQGQHNGRGPGWRRGAGSRR